MLLRHISKVTRLLPCFSTEICPKSQKHINAAIYAFPPQFSKFNVYTTVLCRHRHTTKKQLDTSNEVFGLTYKFRLCIDQFGWSATGGESAGLVSFWAVKNARLGLRGGQ